jgi:hypothetical protein
MIYKRPTLFQEKAAVFLINYCFTKEKTDTSGNEEGGAIPQFNQYRVYKL